MAGRVAGFGSTPSMGSGCGKSGKLASKLSSSIKLGHEGAKIKSK